ncbi:MAG: ATP-dependent helicase [Lachnospiraceae bacterium]|nr:ATP-dependent helicase [Lachnospiraceae bacterium]
MDLNNEQQKAADTVYGPAVVLAGPGSGKTAVITRRTIKLIREEHIPAGNILVVTFTRAAAEEMKRRVYREARSEEEKQVTFGTFHSIFFKILRFACNLDASAVIRESDAVRFIVSCGERLGMSFEDSEMPGEIREEIGKVKSLGGLKKGYFPETCPPEIFSKLYEAYGEMLKKNRLVDFEDMLSMTEELFMNRPEVLEIWREKFKFIMIDEFQDINPLQYRLVRLLAEPENNIFIVGDDDQAIYGFRGSDPRIMLGFEKDFPEAKKIILKKNYRSQAGIVKASERLIGHNSNRFDKRMEAVKPAGTLPEFRVFEDRGEECNAMADKIREYRARGWDYGKMAVIFRTNRLAGQTASAFSAAGIPFSFKGGFRNIYSHFAVRDVLSYIKLALGDKKRETVLGIINRPKRYIKRDLFTKDVFDMKDLKTAVMGNPSLYEAAEKLEYDLAFIARGTPASAVIYIRKAVGYDRYLEEYAGMKGTRPEEFTEVLDRLREEASCFRDFDEWFSFMTRMKNEAERRQDMDRGEDDAVTVTTMHGSKGLEYDLVFIPDANEGVTPYLKALTKDEEEQERRMFYVAVTRAVERLHIYGVRRLNGKDLPISRFVKEMLDFS